MMASLLAHAQTDWAEITRRVSPSIVTVIARTSEGESRGTGFYISSDGKVATNFHVIEGGSNIRVRHEDGQTFTVQRVLAVDEEKDLAILQTDNRRARPLQLGDSDKVERGQEVCVIGSALGVLEGSVTTGVVSGVRNLEGVRFIQISAPISQGNSGSPVLTRRGEVIGIATATIQAGQNINIAVPVNELKRLQTRIGSARPEPSAPTKPSQPSGGADRIVVSSASELLNALNRVKAGGEIVLRPGEYRIRQHMTISKPLTLTGSGFRETVIISEGGRGAIYYDGKGLLQIREMSLIYTGDRIADVVDAISGEVRIHKCVIGGATGQDERTIGTGVWIHGTARAVITETVIGKNALGIGVSEQGSVNLDGVLCFENESHGLMAFDNAKVEARRSRFSDHATTGVLAAGSARLTLLECEFLRNGDGVFLTDNAVATVRGCTSNDNHRHGIAALGRAKLDADGNTCEHNGDSGIFYSGNATGTVRNNTCRYNKQGVYVTGRATPSVYTSNNWKRNKEWDFWDWRND